MMLDALHVTIDGATVPVAVPATNFQALIVSKLVVVATITRERAVDTVTTGTSCQRNAKSAMLAALDAMTIGARAIAADGATTLLALSA